MLHLANILTFCNEERKPIKLFHLAKRGNASGNFAHVHIGHDSRHISHRVHVGNVGNGASLVAGRVPIRANEVGANVFLVRIGTLLVRARDVYL